MKNIFITICLLCSFSLLSGFSFQPSYDVVLLEETTNNTYTGMNCKALLGDPEDANYPAYWIQYSLNIMRYAAIIALLGFSTADFIKAIVAQDNDALQKAIQKTVKRAIYAVILFFVPMIVSFIMNLFGVYGTCYIN